MNKRTKRPYYKYSLKTLVAAILYSGRRITLDELNRYTGRTLGTCSHVIGQLYREGMRIEKSWRRYSWRKGGRMVYCLEDSVEPDRIELKGAEPFFGHSAEVYTHIEDLPLTKRLTWQNPLNSFYDVLSVSFAQRTWVLQSANARTEGHLSDDPYITVFNLLEAVNVRSVCLERRDEILECFLALKGVELCGK